MSKNRTAGLYFLAPGTTMNGPKYMELLKNMLLLHMTVHNTTIFMHNGAPCHRSKIVKKFLGENHVTALDWPGNSPDLNRIKNLWAKMKDLMAEKQPSRGKALTLCGPTNRLGCKNNLCCLVQTHVTHAFSLLPF